MSDVFKKVYTKMPEDVSKIIFEMKEKFEEVHSFMGSINNREMSIAKTKLEEASMWATKAYVNDADARGVSTQP